MRPLLNCITAYTIAACSALTLASTVNGQELQWVQSSQQKPRSTASAGSNSASSPRAQKIEVRRPTAKQPTFRQPQQFKQPTQVTRAPKPARQVAVAAQQAARPLPKQAKKPTQRIAQAERVAQVNRETDSYRHRQSNSGPIGQHSLADQVVPAQWQQTAPCNCGECQDSGSTYAGEMGCGVPEPTCGCIGPCGCGDGMYYEEPGCGIPCGQEMMIGTPGCSDGCCGGGACGCSDACCGDMIGEPTCGCGGSGCDDCSRWPQSLLGCDDRGCVPILWLPPIKEITFFGGVHGFKGPLDGNRDGGNFGFHEGFNIGGKMAWVPWPGLGYQFGYQATHNQLSGDASTASDDAHSQHFVTTGLFRRKRMGLQYGVVWDMLRDERQGANDYGQVRGEVSFKNVANRELGFAFTANSNDNRIGTTTFQATDRYLLFYRINGRNGGECRAFAGFTGKSNALIGSDFHTPLTNRWSLEGNWAYLIPDSGNNGTAARDEAWNLSMQLVWHYGNRGKSWHNRPYRPMFNVADNASLIVVD